MTQKIRIKLKSYDYNLVDKSSEKIVRAVKTTGAVVSGPIPLPTKKEIFTVLRSPHVNKKSREQFQLFTYKRLVDIYSNSTKTVDALMKLELPSGVDVEIKVQRNVIAVKRTNQVIGSFFCSYIKVKLKSGFVNRLNFTSFAVLYKKRLQIYQKTHYTNKKCLV